MLFTVTESTPGELDALSGVERRERAMEGLCKALAGLGYDADARLLRERGGELTVLDELAGIMTLAYDQRTARMLADIDRKARDA